MKKISDNTYVVDLPSCMAMSKIFNVANLYEYHPTEQLYQDYNSRTGSFEEGRTGVGDQGYNRPTYRYSKKAEFSVDRPTQILSSVGRLTKLICCLWSTAYLQEVFPESGVLQSVD